LAGVRYCTDKFCEDESELFQRSNNVDPMRPRIGLLLGDPTGIGPELVAKLLAFPETLAQAQVLVIGDHRLYQRGANIAGALDVHPDFLEYLSSREDHVLGRVSVEAGEYVLGCLRTAIEAWQARRIDAIVFAPLNKQAMKLAGMKQADELHYFADLLGHHGRLSEINICGKLWTSRVTSHIPLGAVAGALTVEGIGGAVDLLRQALRASGVSDPRIAVAALNPHAGEGGLLGTEEIAVIGPAIEKARASGAEVRGPLPADTLFIAARRGDFDGVVTMYHDQGQIALKLLGFDRGVTLAGGLPAVITTPAHGTAFDIAGKGVADVGALREAFSVACRMSAGQASK
jgi:4-hydroxythreonine-4-phosphate dehydrogenase